MFVKFLKTNYFFYSFIILIFISINVLLVLIGRGENRNDKLYLQYVSEKKISDILESYRASGSLEILKNYNDLKGFGIYDIEGTNILSYGTSPLSIEVDDKLLKNNYFKINNFKRSIILIRPVGLKQMHGKSDDFKPKHMKMEKEKFLRLIYIELDLSAHIQNNIPPFLRLGAISITILVIMISFIVLYKKGEKYKTQLEKQNKLAQLGEASRTIAHEIKNPLSAIRIQTGYLKKIFPDKYKDEINVIEEEVDRIKNITDKVRIFLKEPVGNPEKIELPGFLENIISKYDCEIIFNNFLRNEKVYISIDPENLRSIFENVINNAIESYETKGVVEVSLMKDKNYTKINILDRGQGLGNNSQDKIFDPFYTTKIHGSGIGLALTKRFVEAVSGKITVLPREGGGTKVEIIFKLEDKK
jgi:two-component system, NtrC family, sensor histidine kinase HydH